MNINLRGMAARVALLSICLFGYLFTVAPLVNAQVEESSSIEERLAYIEGTLEQMNERLLEINHLSDRIDGVGDSLSVRIDKLHTTIVVGVLAMIGAILVQPFTKDLANKIFK